MTPTAEPSRRAVDPPLRLDVPARLRTKDLLSVGDLSPDEILLILDTAEAMKEVGTRSIKKVPACAATPSSTSSSSRAPAPGPLSRSPRSASAPTP